MNDNDRLSQALQEASVALQAQYGNVKNDFYGLIFLEQIAGVARSQALEQIAFGNHDLGIDGFQLDSEQGVFRIFQFKNSKSINLFTASLVQLHDRGLKALFGDRESVPDHQPIVDSARRMLDEGR